MAIAGTVEVTGIIAPTSTGDTYPVTDSKYGLDGLRNVASISERNAISDDRRRQGMIVGVNGLTTTDYYTLKPSPWTGDNSDWVEFSASSGTISTNYIPLSGTTSGNPVTGRIEMTENAGNLYLSANDGDNYNIISFAETGVELRASYLTTIASSINISNNVIQIDTTDNGGITAGATRGLTGVYNYSPNITDLDYTQKIYVDKAISGATFTGGTVTGPTNFTNGLTANTITATQYNNLPLDKHTTGFTFNPGNYDITIFNNYGSPFTQNLGILSSDMTITGGTYNPATGVATFVNNSGGTFPVSGFLTGYTDTYIVTGTSNSNLGTITLKRSDNEDIIINGVATTFTGGTVTGATNFTNGLTANTIIKSGGTSSQYLMADGSVSTGQTGNYWIASGSSGIISTNSGNTLIGNTTTNVKNYKLAFPSVIGTGAEWGLTSTGSLVMPYLNGSFTTSSIGFNQGGDGITMFLTGFLSNLISSRPSGFRLGTNNLSPLLFVTNDIERMRLNEFGNFSIGTTGQSGTTKFEVSGNSRVIGGFTATTGTFSASSQNIVTVIGSGNSTTPPIFSVRGSQGELFSVSDSLIGSLFSVNDISGLPVLEAFSDNTVLMGSYSAPSLNTTVKISATTGSTNIYSIPTSAYTGAFFDYTINDGTNLRGGNIMSIWSGTTIQYSETSTNDIGNTSGLTFNMIISGSLAILRTSGTTSGWSVKTIVRSI